MAVDPRVEAELGPIVRTLLSESIHYDQAIHSKLCKNGNLDEDDAKKLFPTLLNFHTFKNNINQTTLFKEKLNWAKKIAVDHFLTESTIKDQIFEKLNKYCAICSFDCDEKSPLTPMQQATPLQQTPLTQRPVSLPPTPSLQQTPLQERPVSLPTHMQMQMLSQPTPSSYGDRLQAYRNKMPLMDDTEFKNYVGSMISQHGPGWLEKMQQPSQSRSSKNPFARGGGPCEDAKKEELINCIANGLLTSISKKLKLSGGGRVRRVRRTYKKSQQRQKLRNKKRSMKKRLNRLL
jgi:hypothetical protein